MVNIRYTVPLGAQEQVRIIIFNMLGRKIWEKRIDGLLKEGTHLITWNGLDNHRCSTGSGMYVIRLQVLSTEGNVIRQFERLLTYMR
jgi:hypothetical protein